MKKKWSIIVSKLLAEKFILLGVNRENNKYSRRNLYLLKQKYLVINLFTKRLAIIYIKMYLINYVIYEIFYILYLKDYDVTFCKYKYICFI